MTDGWRRTLGVAWLMGAAVLPWTEGCVECRTSADCPDSTFCALDGHCRDVNPFGLIDTRPDAGADGGFTGGGSSSSGRPLQHPGLTLDEGPGTFLDAFPAPDGVIIVLSTELRKVSRLGALLAVQPLPREALSTLMVGPSLVVADGALATVYSSDLVPQRTVTLIEGCAAMVVFGGNELVCGPAGDWDRVFTVYDLDTGAVRSRSQPDTYHGIPMRAVPGRDAFVTVTTNSSPSDFHLYRRNADGGFGFVNASPYHGDFVVSNSYGFRGNPATHVITPEGLFLKFDGADCQAGNGFTSGCFVRDGALGTVPRGDSYAVMTADGDGVLYGLRGATWWDGCRNGCVLEQVDVEARIVLASRSYAFDGYFAQGPCVRLDTVSGKVLLAYSTGDGFPSPAPYRVALVDYQ